MLSSVLLFNKLGILKFEVEVTLNLFIKFGPKQLNFNISKVYIFNVFEKKRSNTLEALTSRLIPVTGVQPGSELNKKYKNMKSLDYYNSKTLAT